MATVGELTSYRGDAGLGLGSNPQIPVSSPEKFETTNQILRDVATREFQKNILKYNQKINDRDKLYDALSKGEIKTGDTLEQDMPFIRKALDTQTESGKKWLRKGYGDIDGAIQYKKDTQQARDAVTQAQSRLLFADEMDEEIAKEVDPKIREQMIAHKNKVLSNFWGDLPPFQVTSRFNPDRLKYWSPRTEEFEDTAHPLEKGTRTLYDFQDAVARATKDMLDPAGMRNMELLQNRLAEMPMGTLNHYINEINKKQKQLNDENGIPENDPNALTPLKALPRKDGLFDFNKTLPELAALVSMLDIDKFKNEAYSPDKAKVDAAKIKLDQQEAANLHKYRMGQLAIDRDRLNFDKEKLKASKVSEDIAQSAKEFSVNLFSKLTSLADETGIISPAKLKQLTPEELKFLGQSSVEDNKFQLKSAANDIESSKRVRITPEGNLEITTVQTKGSGKDAVISDKVIVVDLKQVAANKLGEEMTITTGKEGFNYNDLISLYKQKDINKKPEITIGERFNINGQIYTKDELLNANWDDEKIRIALEQKKIKKVK